MSKVSNNKITDNVSSKVTPKKMNLTTFLQVEPQETYIVVLLKKNYAMKFYTLTEWEAIVEKIKNKKIN